MSKWETAKAQLDSMVFPGQRFKERDKKFREFRNGGTEQIFGVETSSKAHRQKKENHNGSRTKVSDLLEVNGFKTEFTSDYCFECSRVIKLVGTIFSDELNLCYSKTFIEDKETKAVNVYAGGLNL